MIKNTEETFSLDRIKNNNVAENYVAVYSGFINQAFPLTILETLEKLSLGEQVM